MYEYIDAVHSLAQSATSETVLIGILPPSNAVAAVPSGGSIKQFMSGSRITQMLSINVKATTQEAALDAMNDVHEKLLAGPYPEATAWKVTGISIKSPPLYAGPEGLNERHIYASSIEVRVYLRGDS